jgi:Tfp pilus assembly protein PilW
LPRARAGTSLIELLVTLVLLDLLALTTLHAVLSTQRVFRHVQAGMAIDQGRLDVVRRVAADPSCRDAPAAAIVPVTFAGHPTRPATTVLLRCGR